MRDKEQLNEILEQMQPSPFQGDTLVMNDLDAEELKSKISKEYGSCFGMRFMSSEFVPRNWVLIIDKGKIVSIIKPEEKNDEG